MFFVMSLRLSDHKVLHKIASSSRFFRFRSDFLAFFACISYFEFLEFKEFNKTMIPFALVGYETGYSQLGATRAPRWLFTISYPTRAHGIIVNYLVKEFSAKYKGRSRNLAMGVHMSDGNAQKAQSLYVRQSKIHALRGLGL